MKLPSFDAPPEIRAWEIAKGRMQAGWIEALFRVVEMTLLCGVVVYIERRLGMQAIASTFLTALIALYAQGRATAGVLDILEAQDRTERVKRISYWVVIILCFALFFGVTFLTNYAVPLIARTQN